MQKPYEDSLPADEGAPAWLRVARIVRPQGHRGEVMAELLTDFPERFAAQAMVWLRTALGEEAVRTATIERHRLQQTGHRTRIVFKFAGCDSMNDAEALRGMEVVVPWEQRTPLPEDEVYIAELAGCVLTDTRTGQSLGTVTDVDRESSNTALLVVERAGGGELLVPFVRAYAPRWDLAARTVEMELPEGLLELQPESKPEKRQEQAPPADH